MCASQPFGTSESGVKESPASSAQRHDSLRLMVLCVLTDPLSFLRLGLSRTHVVFCSRARVRYTDGG